MVGSRLPVTHPRPAVDDVTVGRLWLRRWHHCRLLTPLCRRCCRLRRLSPCTSTSTSVNGRRRPGRRSSLSSRPSRCESLVARGGRWGSGLSWCRPSQAWNPRQKFNGVLPSLWKILSDARCYYFIISEVCRKCDSRNLSFTPPDT